MDSAAEISLDEADQNIAEAEHNIRQVGSLIPELAINGYATEEIEGQVQQMLQVLDYLRAQRRSIVEEMDSAHGLPRVAMPPPPAKMGAFRSIYMRLAGA